MNYFDRLRVAVFGESPPRPRFEVTDADRVEAKRQHDELLRKYPGTIAIYIGGSGTVEEYLAEQAYEIARQRLKNEKLRWRRARARARKKASST